MQSLTHGLAHRCVGLQVQDPRQVQPTLAGGNEHNIPGSAYIGPTGRRSLVQQIRCGRRLTRVCPHPELADRLGHDMVRDASVVPLSYFHSIYPALLFDSSTSRMASSLNTLVNLQGYFVWSPDTPFGST